MRKIVYTVFLLAMFKLAYTIELGNIIVASFLNQKLNGKILLSDIKPNSLDDINVSLASSEKFQEYNIGFNPELTKLIFKLISQNEKNIIYVTSSQPILTPVLTFLLHIKLSSNDIYRQYTILLDPIEYNGSLNNNDSSIDNKAILKPKEAPIYAKYSKKTVEDNALSKVKKYNYIKYTADLKNPYIGQRINNLDLANMIYTVLPEESDIYYIGRFEQELFPKAKLEINPTIIALKLENYKIINIDDNLIPPGSKLILATPQNILKIDNDLADEYLLNALLTKSDKEKLLSKIAGSYGKNLLLNDIQVLSNVHNNFSHPESVISKISSKPLALKHLPNEQVIKKSDSFFTTIIGYLNIILGIIVILLITAWYYFHNRQKLKGINDSTQYDDTQTFNNQASNMVLEQISDEVENSLKDTTVLLKNSNIGTELNTPNIAHPDINSEELPQTELLEILSNILIIDETRNDIRFKLMELYFSNDNLQAAYKIYKELESRLDKEDADYEKLQQLKKQYNFSDDEIIQSTRVDNLINSTKVSVPLNEAVENSYSPDLAKSKDFPQANQVKKLAKDNTENNIDFYVPKNSSDNESVLSEEVEFDKYRILDFSSNLASENNKNLTQDITVDSISTVKYDEIFDLAKMYYQIAENAKAQDLLQKVINDPNTPEEVVNAANKILSNYEL